MPRAKRTLSEGTANAKAPAAKSAKVGNRGGSANTAPASDAPNATNNGVTDVASTASNAPNFVTFCRPVWDTVAEREANGEVSDEDEADADGWASADEDDDSNDEGFEDLGEVELQDEASDEERRVEIEHGPDCMCKKSTRDHPDWIWVFTEEGLKLFAQWQFEAAKRDQHAFGFGYATSPTLTNPQLLAFNKAMNKKPFSPFALWSLVESIGALLSNYIDPWFGGDDSAGMAEIVMIFGTAVLTTLEILRAHILLVPHTPSSPAPIRNVGLVLSLFFSFVSNWKSIGGDHSFGETYWRRKAVQIADEAGIEIKGPFGTEATVAEIRAEMEEEELWSDESDDEIGSEVEATKAKGKKWKPEDYRYKFERRRWKKWDWKIEFAEYVKYHGKIHRPGGKPAIGGDYYDITKMLEEQKRGRY